MQVIGRFHIPLDPEENQKLNSCPFSEILQGNWHEPNERPRWECRPPTWAFALHDRCSPVSGWVAWALSPQSGCGEVPCRPGLQASPLDLALPSACGPWWPLGTASHFCLVFSLLGPAGLIPGAGWVWEEDEDSWDSLAGGLLAWSWAKLLSHPYHSLPRPWFMIGT